MNLPTEPNGLLMEHILAHVLGLELVTDKRQFTHDADLISPNGVLYSVKFQKAAARTGNFSFETRLISTQTGEEMPGNFVSNATERYIIAVPEPAIAFYTAFEFDTNNLHYRVMSPPDSIKGGWRKVRLTGQAKGTNAGRKFDDAENLLVPMKHLVGAALKRYPISYRAIAENSVFLESLKKQGYGKRKR